MTRRHHNPFVALACAAATVMLSLGVAHGSDASGNGREGYVGSAECAGCHTQIYNTWLSTRHAYSVLTADEARRAGYPLPEARQGGEQPAVRTWDEVSYVVGGRQRIAYADRNGDVLDTSYHHRIAKWSGFPPMKMTACGPCHFTGFGAGEPHLDDPAVPVPWAERNIGCEACHGPGQRHSMSLEPEDILVDASVRACGQCHTAAGKVLPKDDLHDTHDLVQAWNQDRHVTGVRFHSHNAFCSSCHSPYERGALPPHEDGARSRVFSENTQNITCIACHNPHLMTNAHYRKEEVSLEPPKPPERHVYRGNDEDFTTTDFEHFPSTEESCIQCHRGPDRIDLDHADATCNDCHNTFNRNRQPESRAFHDTNRRELSCRPCHQDADHLISILYRDPDFLQPENVHNLRTLPQEVIQRYGFQYAGLRPRKLLILPDRPGALQIPEGMSASAIVRPGPAPAADGLQDRLRNEHHRRLAGDEEIRSLQAVLAQDEASLSGYVALAAAYARQGEYEAVRDLLGYAGSGASPRSFRNLLFLAGSSARAATEAEPMGSLPADSGAQAVRLWLEGFAELTQGRAASATGALAQARRLLPRDASLGLHLALAQLGERNYDAAIDTLEEVLEAQPGHVPSRIALGAIYINYRRLAPARENLERATAVDPDDALAHYFLGRTLLRMRHPEQAAEALRASITSNPGELNAWFFLARAYRSGGFYGAAVDTYDELVRRRPGLFHPHNELALLYKFLSDKIAFAHLSASETAPPLGVGAVPWREHLSQLRRQSSEYGELALVEFGRAHRIQPLDLENVRQIGEIFRRAGRLEEARESVEWLVGQEPGSWLPRYRLGTILIRMGELREATRRLEEALELSSTQGEPYIALGLAYALSGRRADAIATLEQGAIHEPFNPALYTNLGAAYAGRGDYELARKALERALELDTFPLPRVHLAYTNLALVHLQEGRTREAVRALKSALHAFPDYPYARSLLESMAQGKDGAAGKEYVLNDLLEIAGEVTTVAFADE